MEERPRNTNEDDSQEDLENEEGELSLNRRRLFLKNGFFREWLSNSSKESSDEEDEEDDDETPLFGTSKKFKGFLSKIFEEEPTEDEQEKPKFFEPEHAISESPKEEPAEVSIDHAPISEQIEEVLPVDERPSFTEEIPSQTKETVQVEKEPGAEPINSTQEVEAKTLPQKEEEPIYAKYLESSPSYGESEQKIEAPKVEKQKASEKDKSGALLAFLAAEFLSRRRDRKIRKEAKKTNKSIDSIKESLQTVKTKPETSPQIVKKEIIKDDKNTTDYKKTKPETAKIIEKKEERDTQQKPEIKKEIVIEKTTIEAEQKEETPAEVYFDKRHEVIGLEKPKPITPEDIKEILKEQKQQAPVSVGSVLANKQLDNNEYISAPIPQFNVSSKNQDIPFEQEITPKKNIYRESAETGFLIGVVILGFIVVYLISR